MTQVSGTALTSELVMVQVKPALYAHLKSAAAPEVVSLFSFGEKVIAALLDAGILTGVRYPTAPANPSIGMIWLKPAIAATLPDLEKDAEVKMWDGTAWIDPTFEKIAESMCNTAKCYAVKTKAPLTGTGTDTDPIRIDTTGFKTGDKLVIEVTADGAKLTNLSSTSGTEQPGSGELL